MSNCYVRVWTPHDGMIGHAAMESGGDYISWWPEEAAYAAAASEYTPMTGASHTLLEDLDPEVGEGRAPDFRIGPIRDLDTGAIKTWWDAFRVDPASTWSLDGSNCSWVVMAALWAGGANKYWPFRRFFEAMIGGGATGSLPVSPYDCVTGARILVGQYDWSIPQLGQYTYRRMANGLGNAYYYGAAARRSAYQKVMGAFFD